MYTNSGKFFSFIILGVVRRSYALTGPVSASLCPGSRAPFEKMSQRQQAVGNIVLDLTGPRFEPQAPSPVTKALAPDQLTGNNIISF